MKHLMHGSNFKENLRKDKWDSVILAYQAATRDPRIEINHDLVVELSNLRELSGYTPYALERCEAAQVYLDPNFTNRDLRTVLNQEQAKIARRRVNGFRMAFCAAALNDTESKVSSQGDIKFFKEFSFTLSPREAFALVEDYHQATKKGDYVAVDKMDKAQELIFSAKSFLTEQTIENKDLGLEFLADEVEDVPFSTIDAFKRPQAIQVNSAQKRFG